MIYDILVFIHHSVYLTRPIFMIFYMNNFHSNEWGSKLTEGMFMNLVILRSSLGTISFQSFISFLSFFAPVPITFCFKYSQKLTCSCSLKNYLSNKFDYNKVIGKVNRSWARLSSPVSVFIPTLVLPVKSPDTGPTRQQTGKTQNGIPNKGRWNCFFSPRGCPPLRPLAIGY
jgi:hypothetical protein